ncbi:hypothetical protein BKA63DRAFT_549107, partial [Paraphoma chrysanthemicola]
MSGLEIAGAVLAAFPLIISGLEHWEKVAKIQGFFWQFRKAYNRCRADMMYHETIYRGNLKELLLPIVSESDMNALLKNGADARWTDNVALQGRLEERLHDSYKSYVETISRLTDTMAALQEELCVQNPVVQNAITHPNSVKAHIHQQAPSQKASLSTRTKTNISYQIYRIKFSTREHERSSLFRQLQDYNERLNLLLSQSDRLSALQVQTGHDWKQNRSLEKIFRRVWKCSKGLYQSLEQAWNCTCCQKHAANLQLEHRTKDDIYFNLILTSMEESHQGQCGSWSWREIRCNQSETTINTASRGAALPTSFKTQQNPGSSGGRRSVSFAPVTSIPSLQSSTAPAPISSLCQQLADSSRIHCLGTIGCDETEYTLHHSEQFCDHRDSHAKSLDNILAESRIGSQYFVSRRRRYRIALLIASTVAQLKATPWLFSGFGKKDIKFFPLVDAGGSVIFGEPFIEKGFHGTATSRNHSTTDFNFQSLGIILLELCFGHRLEDHPIRRKYAPGNDAQSEAAFDLVAAIAWLQNVEEEAGADYAWAVVDVAQDVMPRHSGAILAQVTCNREEQRIIIVPNRHAPRFYRHYDCYERISLVLRFQDESSANHRLSIFCRENCFAVILSRLELRSASLCAYTIFYTRLRQITVKEELCRSWTAARQTLGHNAFQSPLTDDHTKPMTSVVIVKNLIGK